MKKIISSLFFLSLCAFGYAQSPLENIIVENYYISNADDYTGSINTSGDTLLVGSVTYRIYVDMRPGYKLETVYGSPTHPLSISTTTSFFNNSNGATTPHSISKANDAHDTEMLDSWISMGEGCKSNFGILKSRDNGVSNVVNSDGLLQNNDAKAGIPLTQQDGLIAGTPGSILTVGIDSAIEVLDAANHAGNLFSTTNGTWACLNGAIGPDTANQVLIAQITTDGVMCFQLNIQIGDSVGNTWLYTANNDTANGEIYFADLNFCSNTVGVKNITSSTASFKVYPNPVNDHVNMEIVSAKESTDNGYTIYGVAGNVISSKKLGRINGSYLEHLDVSSLASGLYIIQLTMDGSTSYQKIVKN